MATAGMSTAALRGLRDRIASMGEPPFQTRLAHLCGAAALKLVADEFRGSHAPDGAGWKPLARRSGKPLMDTGRLRASFAIEATADGFRIGTAVAYAGYHQFGTRPHRVASRLARQNAHGRFISAKARKVSRKAFEGTTTRSGYLVRIREHQRHGIPARPMLPERDLPTTWRDAMQREIARAVRARMKGEAL
jgi:phage gpG-like protein